jgi:hypothetical protein
MSAAGDRDRLEAYRMYVEEVDGSETQQMQPVPASQ